MSRSESSESKTISDLTIIDNLMYYYPNSELDLFPMCLNPDKCNSDIILSQSDTMATCEPSGMSEAFAVASNRPVPTSCAIYYYEATVLCDGMDGHIAVGFGSQENNTLLPGWDNKSIGYHADDGLVFMSTYKQYGSGYKCGDVVGCGVNFLTNRFFFTQNGLFYGYFPDTFLSKDPSPFYIILGMQSMRESVSVNFGQEWFVFDLKNFMNREQGILMKTIKNSSTIHANVVCRMVVEYLVYHGYYKTAVAFGNMVSSDIHLDASLFRFSQELKGLITEGNMAKAIENCLERFPDMFEKHKTVYFRMKVQHFVETIMFHHRRLCPIDSFTTFADPDNNIHRREEFSMEVEDIEMSESDVSVFTYLSKESAVNLIIYARELFVLCKQLFSEDSSEFDANEELLIKAVSLIEFEDPWKSPYGDFLMIPSRRTEIFSTINSIILESFCSQKIPSIEVACNQLNKCVDLMRKLKIPQSYLIP